MAATGNKKLPFPFLGNCQLPPACQSPNLVTTILSAKTYVVLHGRQQYLTTAQRRGPPSAGQTEMNVQGELRA